MNNAADNFPLQNQPKQKMTQAVLPRDNALILKKKNNISQRILLLLLQKKFCRTKRYSRVKMIGFLECCDASSKSQEGQDSGCLQLLQQAGQWAGGWHQASQRAAAARGLLPSPRAAPESSVASS